MLVIPEIKRGNINFLFKNCIERFNVVELAKGFQSQGAKIIAVECHSLFAGNIAWIKQIREAVGLDLEIIARGLVINKSEVETFKLAGADYIVIISRFIRNEKFLQELIDYANNCEIKPILQVDNLSEAAKLKNLDITEVLVSNFDIFSGESRVARSELLYEYMPSKITSLISSGGIHSKKTISRLAELGYNKIIAGEVLMQSLNPILSYASIK